MFLLQWIVENVPKLRRYLVSAALNYSELLYEAYNDVSGISNEEIKAHFKESNWLMKGKTQRRNVSNIS